MGNKEVQGNINTIDKANGYHFVLIYINDAHKIANACLSVCVAGSRKSG